jgi:outer membrane protein TolC
MDNSVVSTGTVLGADDLVKIALQANPQVLEAKAQYESALHQIQQAYTPNDPDLSWSENNSIQGLWHPSSTTLGISDSFQFPGKAWLQGDEAHRTAEIARLTYMVALRDTRAQALTSYYQTLLDSATVEISYENTESFTQVLEVAKVAYSANQVTESDLISAQFQVAQSSQTVWASIVAKSNDEAGLNQVLGREPETTLSITNDMDLKPVELPLNQVKKKALAFRQELIEAALSEKNAKTALQLAWMEMLPDFNLSYARNHYILPSAPPTSDITTDSGDNTVSLGINVPIFFWFHQKEDIRSAARLLDAARANRRIVELQTETSVIQLYRTTQLAYKTTLLYKNFLVPLAYKNFRVALIAYQSNKVDFTTLANALQNLNSARLTYLTSANQFLAGRVGLEQLMGGPLI